jgi:hypothetical protein
MDNLPFKFSEEVALALKNGQPIVALESTIIVCRRSFGSLFYLSLINCCYCLAILLLHSVADCVESWPAISGKREAGE